MYGNGNEINLYNFKYNNEEEYYDIKGKSITKPMKTQLMEQDYLRLLRENIRYLDIINA